MKCDCPKCMKLYYDPKIEYSLNNSDMTRLNMHNMYWTRPLVDCAYSDYKYCRMPIRQQGSPYNVYNYDGSLRKDLPLNERPPIGYKFAGAEGNMIPDMNYTRPKCPDGLLLKDGVGPCIGPAACKMMKGKMCKYDKNDIQADSCYTNISFGFGRCPQSIKKQY